jgi:hypothetical protein
MPVILTTLPVSWKELEVSTLTQAAVLEFVQATTSRFPFPDGHRFQSSNSSFNELQVQTT